jgi:hypothetical protein
MESNKKKRRNNKSEALINNYIGLVHCARKTFALSLPLHARTRLSKVFSHLPCVFENALD